MTSRNLLVTGGAGFIGSEFVAQAADKGYKVIILDALTYAGNRVNLNSINPQSHTLIVGNITDGALVSRLLREHQIDAIVHFAAESHVDNSISGPAVFINTNIIGSYRLLEAAREYHNSLPEDKKAAFRYVHVSTDEVYGALGKTGHFTEESPLRPNSPYSASKAASDLLSRAWHITYGLPVTVTNCSNNYGPRQYPEKLIPLMIKNATSGKQLPVYGDGSNIRDWIHVSDHCRGVMLALEKGKSGETYCFGGNSEIANIDLVKKICHILDEIIPSRTGKPYQSQIEFVKDRLGHDYRYAIDDSKAKATLGFKQLHALDSGLRSTVEWYINEYSNSQNNASSTAR